ncbi:structural maintenance of chromosomes protein 5 [Thraustotheca clavata]|uniref:Structural maintenance of chromosomes protein 5 n=1 Tax=Thraustotheca clavata TaxID=74557 RepID=A0A1W0A979_9STRA|nr:structural maintenance of chromosomes protein 5 [Thraustotheca clavata]
MEHKGNNEYMEGSIYRVRLHNFLTYNDAELFPGPRLNVVLGPNGTGKSSIVCALCVGLGGSTKLLGRAEKVGQFVKHEKDVGFTEIELYFERGNKTIRRTIYRDNKSMWQLNGRDVSQTKIKEILGRASIQIDNLCQFLPQDKVGEFSRMTPVQLLKATQVAIGNGELAEQQEKVIQIQRESSTSERDLEAARASLELKKTENLQREKEVERIREHESRRTQTANMEKKILWLEFDEYKQKVIQLKARKTQLKEALKLAKAQQLTPLETLLSKQAEAKESVREKKKQLSDARTAHEKKLANLKLQMDHLDREESQTKLELREVHGRRQRMQEKLDRMTQQIQTYQQTLDELPSEEELRERKAALDNELSNLDNQFAEVRVQREHDNREYDRLTHELRRVDSQLERLNNEQVQRKNHLTRADKDCMRAYDWVQNNLNRFRRKVWGPLALEIQVKNPVHAKCLEDTLQNWQLTCFVTECREDSDLLIRELNEGAQRIGVSVINVQDARCGSIDRPYTKDQLDELRANYGMSCYLDEVINAPDIIHEVLRVHGGIHTVLLASQETENMINRGVDIFTPLTRLNRKAAFCTPTKKYVSSVSKYGNRDTVTRTNDIRDCRFLGVSNSNEELKEELQNRNDGFKHTMQELKQRMDDNRTQEREYADRKHQLTHQVHDIRERIRERNKLTGQIQDGISKMRSYEAELAQDFSDKVEALERKLKNLLTKHIKLVNESQVQATNLVHTTTAAAEFALETQAIDQRHAVIQRIIREEAGKLERLKYQYDEARSQLEDAGRQAVELKRRAERAAPWEEYESIFQGLSNDIMELRACIDNNKAAQEYFRGDIRIVEVYERVLEEIADEEEHLARLTSDMETLTDRINAVKEPWLRELTSVIEKINTAFKQFFEEIGCVGEIYLNQEDNDISKWGIERRAQFRANTSLTRMTAEEQSGGEKSVGTIMYLMALQSLTKCPFRVVDEINQGMDIYNERKVFRRITRSSCGAKLPQYFLITPKLITGLEYHPDTKVLVIINGSYNISQEEWSVSRFLQQPRIKRMRLNS